MLKKYATTPSLKSHFFQNSGDRTWYLTMNLTQPPFDDIHVRRAMNCIIDKAALRQAWGGPAVGQIANHIVPDSIFGGALADYAPYKTPGDHGSVSRRRLAMKGSKYDTNKSGMCVAKACKNVLLISDARAVDPSMVATMQQDARRSASPSRSGRSTGRTRRSRRSRRTFRSPSARVGARTTPTP